MNNKEKKKYWKLPSQLRMEYDNKLEMLEGLKTRYTLSFIWEVAIIYVALFICANLFYMNFESTIFFKILFAIMKVLPYMIFAGFVMDIVGRVEYHKKAKKLKELFLNGKVKL